MKINVYGHIIDETLIKGISPLTVKTMPSCDGSSVTQMCFDIYLDAYSVSISSADNDVLDYEKLNNIKNIKQIYTTLRAAVISRNYSDLYIVTDEPANNTKVN